MASNYYDPIVYANLPDFFQAKEFLSHYQSYIDDAGEIIKSYGVNGKIGINLLHKHFNLLSDELLVRHIERDKIIIKPLRIGKIEVCAFSWAFAKKSIDAPYQLHPVEFIRKNDCHEWVGSINDFIGENSSFQNELFSYLSTKGLINYFGIGLNPRPLMKIEKNQTLMEEDNHAERKLILNIVSIESIDHTESTQTLWTF
ncbi:hypothetical protein [Raoultella sp. C349492]|uniref:hypothetical protein n=1 Tax=Raoultella sp. C349492 TaxID=2970253 RepID=UPI0035C727C9